MVRFGSNIERSLYRSAQTVEAAGCQPAVSVFVGGMELAELATLAGLPHTHLFFTQVRLLPSWVILERTGRFPHATLYLPGADWYWTHELAGRFHGPCPNPANAARLTPRFPVGRH